MFFYFSKLIWSIVAPGNLLIILLSVGIVLLLMNKIRYAKIVLSTVSTVFIVISMFPVGHWLLYPLEGQFSIEPVLPLQVDGIIVLSGAVVAKATAQTGQVQVNEKVDRELAFMKLARRYPEAKLLYTGGSSSLTHQQFKGADAGRQLLEEQGIDLSRVVFERDSRNTSESAHLSIKKVQPELDESWVLITTAWHMPRSIGVFCKEGWSVIPYPVDYNGSNRFSFGFNFTAHLLGLEVAVKEWLGLLAYWMSGRIPSLIPDRC